MDASSASSGKRCRACLQHSGHQLYSIISNITCEGIEQTLAEIYNQCTQLQCEPSDLIWDSICQICSDKFIEFFQFRKMCIESYNTIKSASYSNFKVEIDELNESVTSYLEPNKPIGEVEYSERQSNQSFRNDEMISIEECIFKGENIEVDQDFTIEDGTDTEGSESMDFTTQKPTEGDEDDSDSKDDVWKVGSSTLTMYENVSHMFFSSSKSLPELPPQPKAAKRKNPPKKEGAKPNPFLYDYACDLCPKKFIKKTRYEAHKRKHQGLKQWQCQHCDKGFGKSYTLKVHMAAKHYDEAEGKPEFICDYDGCGKIYNMKVSRDSVNLHCNFIHLIF